MTPPPISDREFAQFQRFIHEAAGISLSPSKKALVSGRLAKRLHHCNAASYEDYYQMLAGGRAPHEVQTAIDLLTTNETYFFREPKHFERLTKIAKDGASETRPFRVWSAASSSGEEAYSIAMVLADTLPRRPWEVIGSDISQRVLARARTGHYVMERTSHVPPSYLKRFCLRGTGQQEGTLLVDREIRSRVRFVQVNLNEALPALGEFDVIFLRNVMIYFNADTKRQVVARLVATLRPGGQFFVGHSETLNDLTDRLRLVAPSVYLKPADGGAGAR